MLANAEFTMISESSKNKSFENGLKISLLHDIIVLKSLQIRSNPLPLIDGIDEKLK